MKSFMLLLAVACSVGLLNPHIKSPASVKNGPDTLAYTIVYDSLRDMKNIDSVYGRAYIYMEYPRFIGEHTAVIDSIQASIRGWMLGSRYYNDTTMNVPKIMEEFIKGYQVYREEVEDFAYPWFSDNSFMLVLNTPDIVCLELSGSSYIGGAHGNSTVTYKIFANPNGNALHWTSFIKPGEAELVRSVAERIFRRHNNLSPSTSLDSAGFWFKDNRFSLTDNAGVTDTAFTFFYNNYDIASYADGPTRIVIPYDSIAQAIPIGSPLRAYIKRTNN